MGPNEVLVAVWLIGAVLIGVLSWLAALIYERVLEQRWRERNRDRTLEPGSERRRRRS